jgi:hypothetical protein
MIAFRDLLAAGSSRQDLPPGASGEGPAYVFAGALALVEKEKKKQENHNHEPRLSAGNNSCTKCMRLHVACA